MADLVGALRSGFEIGAAGGGRLSGIGSALKGIADELRSKREFDRELEGKKTMLGETERVKALYREPEPTTQAIVSRTGEKIGERDIGSVFAPKEDIEPKGYQESLANAVAAVEGGQDSLKVFRKMALNFPKKSAELKRILVSSPKLGEVDISDMLWGK